MHDCFWATLGQLFMIFLGHERVFNKNKIEIMKNIYTLFFILLVFAGYSGNPKGHSTITNDLQNYLSQKSDNELIRVNIRMKDQLNLSSQLADFKGLSKDMRRSTVVNELKAFAASSQSSLLSFLGQQSSQNYKSRYQFWIANVVTCYVSESLLQQLAGRQDIASIDIDEERNLLEKESDPVALPPNDKSVNEITYNVLKVNADDVWAEGYTGEGIIVSVIDVGVNYNHNDLTDHMWQSTDYPNHGYDFYNNDDDPMDDNGHGTHCAGTVAGDGTAGSQTGMAPDALIMACKVLDSGGYGHESDVWAGIEFSVAHGADIISMSLGWPHSSNPDRYTWRNTLDNALAAGMVASIAAGNEGGSVTNPDDVRTPGDCPPPWLNPEQTLTGGISAVVCIGATDASDNIADFSSRGPSTWETIDPYNDYPYNPEMGLLRPDVSAPGVDIKSCDASNINGYTMMSGTSMATPCTAGVMALLMSKNPNLSPEDISMTLETTAVDLGDPGKDNVFGAGRIDALNAIDNTSEQGPTYESYSLNDPNANGEVEAGESISMTVSLINASDFDYSNVDVTITCSSPYISMTDSLENYGDFASGQSVAVNDAFAFNVSEDMPGLESLRFDISATDGIEIWGSHFVITSFGPKLYIGSMSIDDAGGNANGRLDPGETATIYIDVYNDGQVDAQNVEMSLTNGDNSLNFENTSFTIDAIAAATTAQASFVVTVDENANIGEEVSFIVDMLSGAYTDAKEFSLVVGLFIEDWETGDFSQFDWSFSGGDWFVTDADPYEENYCSQSYAISDNGQTSLEIDYEVGAAGTLSFFKKVSSETNFDFLKFYIDGAEQGSWSGEVDWSMESYDIGVGQHTFKWIYSKDGSVSVGSDAAWVDYIVFPPMAFPSINMDSEAEICEGQQYTGTAQADNYLSLEWSTTGDGIFDDATALNPIYTPGTQDIENTQLVLSLTAIGTNGSVSSSLSLHISPIVLDAPLAPQGPNTLCVNGGDQSYHSSINYGEVLIWQLNPETAGTINSIADSAMVTWADDFVGQAEISLKKTNPCAESEFSEPLIVNVNPLPEMVINENMEACYGQNVLATAELSGTAPWTISIDGVGELQADESPYTISWMAYQDSSFIILSVADANACVNDAQHLISVVVNESPTVYLGADTSICMNHQITLDAANDGASFLWSTDETTQTIVADSSGLDANNEKTISVVVTNEYNCSTEDEMLISFQDCSGIDELSSIDYVKVYPNPNHGQFELSLESLAHQTIHLQIRNLLGVMVYQEDIKVNKGNIKHSIDISNLAPQTYLLMIKTDEGQVIQRLVVE